MRRIAWRSKLCSRQMSQCRSSVATRAQDIEDAVYDLEAVNPNKQAEDDTRTPAELLDIIEQKGREVAAAVVAMLAGKRVRNRK